MSKLPLLTIDALDTPYTMNNAVNTLMSCGMYSEYDAKKKIKECIGGVYEISIITNAGSINKLYRIPVGIVGCKRIFKSELPISIDLKYHPQINDAMYYIEFLHVDSDSLMSDNEMILQALDLAINTVAKDKNDAPIFVDSKCISTYIDNYIEIMKNLHFEYYENEENKYFIRYPITNKTN